MNFALSEEQEFLKEAARGTLSRVKTVEAAREAIEGGALPDLWPAAVEAGWPGLLVAEDAGGAGLGPMDAMLVFEEMGRVLASVPLLGHLPATFLHPDAELAEGTRRAAYLPARPPSDIEHRWTVDAELGSVRGPAPTIADDGTVSGGVAWVPDASGADVLVVVGDEGRVAVVEAAEAKVQALWRYDATRSLGHVAFDGAAGAVLDCDPDTVAAAWYLAQTLLAAEALGASDLALETSVAYAKERFTFGRAIGSYQAVKHSLVEILRLADNARSLMYYAGWAGADKPDEFPLAASAFRHSAGKAVEYATRAQISVHGGIGATWEHDAPLYFRRAQLSRRLLGGTQGAADRVADELFATARADVALTAVPAAASAEEAGATMGEPA
jgi:alkylation response protein AidB-like acyl-CoA dehydrogenase